MSAAIDMARFYSFTLPNQWGIGRHLILAAAGLALLWGLRTPGASAGALMYPSKCDPADLHNAQVADCERRPEGRHVTAHGARLAPRQPVTAAIFPWSGVRFTPLPRDPTVVQQRWFPQISQRHVSTSGARLSHGPLFGNVSTTAATVFVRTSSTAYVQVQIATDPEQQTNRALSQATVAAAESDYATQIDLQDLVPDTIYYVNILVNGAAQFSQDLPRFKTFPVYRQGLVKIVHLSDFSTTYDRGTMLRTDTFTSAARENADLVVIGGDFDHREPATLAAKRQMFKDLYNIADPNMQSFVSGILWRTPVAHAWDDHDYGRNDDDKGYYLKDLSYRALHEFFPLYPTPGAPGIWQRFTLGPADIFLIDSRSQRDNADDPDNEQKSMLDGNNLGVLGQRYWLEQGLLHSTAAWKILFVQVPFNPTVHKRDSWRVYETERQWLLRLVRDNGIQGVVLISGDIHAGGIDSGRHSGLPEMVVPAANFRQCLTIWGRDRATYGMGEWDNGTYWHMNEYDACPGYGVITASADPPRLVLQVKDANGAVQAATILAY